MSTLKELHGLAEQGDAEAQYQLGVYYTQEVQLADAVKYFDRAAKQGNFLAKLHLAQLHTKSKEQFKDAEPYIALELYEGLVKENPDDLQVKFELGVMYCTAGTGFMGYEDGYILRNGRRMERMVKEGRKLIEDVLNSVNPDNLPYSGISTLATLYGDGWLRDKREPTINDMMQGIKYKNRAVELATGLVDTNILYKDLIELGKKYIDALKRRMKAGLNVWRCGQRIIVAAGGSGISYGDETFFDDVGFDDNAILEKLKKCGFDDIANELIQEWRDEKEKESSKIEQSEDNDDVIRFLIKTTMTQLNLPDTPDTYYDLGNRFLTTGLDKPESGPDAAKVAMYCFRKAADKGHPGGQAGIASGYLSGFGLEKNWKEAEYWARKSADKGDINGFYSLGIVLAAKNDFENAEYWLTKAINGGHEEAKTTLQQMLAMKKATKIIKGNMIENSNADAIQNKFCANCGALMDDESIFCGNCGSAVEPEEQTASFAPHAVSAKPYSPELLEPSTIESEKQKPPRNAIVIAAVVIAIVIVGILAWKIQNDRKFEAAEKVRIAKQAEDDAAKARIAKQVEDAQQVRIAAEQALAAAEQARIEKQVEDAQQARIASERALAAEQARIVKQAEEAQKARAAAEKAEQARAAAEKAEQMAEQLRKIQEKRNVTSSASKTPAPPGSGKLPPAANPQSASKVVLVNLTSGTPINVITSSTISTENSKTGEGFEAVLSEDIAYDGRVVARRGSIVKGVISESDPGGRVRGVATISLRLTVVTLADGRQVSVTTNNHTLEASSSVGKDVTKTGIGAGIGAAIGAIAGGGRGAAIGAAIGGAGGTATALATRGDPAVIAKETEITFNLTLPLSFVLKY